jgi:phosphate transport system ATP-binding protein
MPWKLRVKMPEINRGKNEIQVMSRQLDLFYGEFQALKKVDLNIFKNQVTALIGPSGCGKSTYLKTLNRMNDLIPDVRISGEVVIDDQNIYAAGIDVNQLRKKIGMVAQKPNPLPMSIYENVAYGPKVHGTRKHRDLDRIVEKSLRRAALWDEVKDRLRSDAYGLSGGQQQRLCIARALAVEPEILLLDESTSALDPASTQKVEDLMLELKQDYTIIIVTHNMQQAARISDQTAFFMLGEVLESGRTVDIFNNPRHEQTEAYVSGKFG